MVPKLLVGALHPPSGSQPISGDGRQAGLDSDSSLIFTLGTKQDVFLGDEQQ